MLAYLWCFLGALPLAYLGVWALFRGTPEEGEPALSIAAGLVAAVSAWIVLALL